MSGEQSYATADVTTAGQLVLSWLKTVTYGGRSCNALMIAFHDGPRRYVGNGANGWRVAQALPVDMQYLNTTDGLYHKVFYAPAAGVIVTATDVLLIPIYGTGAGFTEYSPEVTSSTPFAGLAMLPQLPGAAPWNPSVLALACNGTDVGNASAWYPVIQGTLQPGTAAPGGVLTTQIGYWGASKLFTSGVQWWISPPFQDEDLATVLANYNVETGPGYTSPSGPPYTIAPNIQYITQTMNDSIGLMIWSDASSVPALTAQDSGFQADLIYPQGPADPYPFQLVASGSFEGQYWWYYVSPQRPQQNCFPGVLWVTAEVAGSTILEISLNGLGFTCAPFPASFTTAANTGSGTAFTSGSITITQEQIDQANGAMVILLFLSIDQNGETFLVTDPALSGSQYQQICTSDTDSMGSPYVNTSVWALLAVAPGTYSASATITVGLATPDWGSTLTALPYGVPLYFQPSNVGPVACPFYAQYRLPIGFPRIFLQGLPCANTPNGTLYFNYSAYWRNGGPVEPWAAAGAFNGKEFVLLYAYQTSTSPNDWTIQCVITPNMWSWYNATVADTGWTSTMATPPAAETRLDPCGLCCVSANVLVGLLVQSYNLYAIWSYNGGQDWHRGSAPIAALPNPMACPPQLAAIDGMVYAYWLDGSAAPHFVCSTDNGQTWQ